ncbi:MAG TPA: ABC transporter ATP-binding protein [Vicinamibacteria bacterium]|nr:ABC transporter ATP-binding protein [Vicinamibacteria bacterium]
MVLRVLGYLRAHRLRFAGGLSLTGLGILLDLAKPLPLAIVLDVVLSGRPLPSSLASLLGGLSREALLVVAALAIVLVTVVRGASTLGANYLTIDIGQRMVNDLRTELYAHLQKLSLKFHYQQQTGDLLFRVMSDTFCIQSMVMNGLLPFVSAAATLALMFWVMVAYDVELALVSLLVGPPLYLAISRLSGWIHGHAAASRQAESDLYSRAQSTIGAVKLVQAYGREQKAVDEFRQGSERSLALSLRLYSSESVFGLVVETLLAFGTAGLVYLGARHVIEGSLSIGSLTIFLSYLRDMYQPIQSISHNLAELSASRAGLDRVFHVLDIQPDIQDAPGARPLPPVRGEIALEAVTFGYDDKVVLDGVSLRIAPGEKIALVGRTGAGKSTLASLVLRFFDPQQGRVKIDGHDLREVTLRSLREQVTLMLQEPILFHSAVADNIAFGDTAADRAKIEEAAKRAEADSFIRELKDGYDTVLGEEGLTLSGGQRQRLALARALLRSTPIVLLDEPTSSLDLATEELVWRNVEALLQGKTAIVIAHRLSTARMADRIVVLERGKIVEQGSHQELLARGGDYARLWERHAITRTAGTDVIPANWD